jgi:hypothetical protein
LKSGFFERYFWLEMKSLGVRGWSTMKTRIDFSLKSGYQQMWFRGTPNSRDNLFGDEKGEEKITPQMRREKHEKLMKQLQDRKNKQHPPFHMNFAALRIGFYSGTLGSIMGIGGGNLAGTILLIL